MAKKNAKLPDLEERYAEVSDYLMSLTEDYRSLEEELRYLCEFLSYKHLEEEFCYFRANAHEEYDEDMPFPYPCMLG